jgi:hypothetical protein
MRTALLLLGFDRVDYFSKTLASLAANPEAHEHDLHLYLDGGPKARQDELIKLVEQSNFSNPTIVRRDSNWGVGRHLIDARRSLFDEQGYDRIILFEDDMTLYPDYVKTVLALSDWSEKYSDIGTVMAYNLNPTSKEVQEQALDQIIVTNRHFWGYCITRKVWDDIKDIIYQYEDKYIGSFPYNDRPHRRIRMFFIRRWMKKGRRILGGEKLAPEHLLLAPFPKFPWWSPTSQDAITALALWVRGYCRLTTVVPRARYIGEKGLHFSPEVFKAQGFDSQQDYDFSEIKDSHDFALLTKDAQGDPLKPGSYE